MSVYSICVVGGWCGNRMVIVADHLREILINSGFVVKVNTFSVWENYSTAPVADLILQLLPAYSQEETGRKVINIRLLLRDLDDKQTIDEIIEQVRSDFFARKRM